MYFFRVTYPSARLVDDPRRVWGLRIESVHNPLDIRNIFTFHECFARRTANREAFETLPLKSAHKKIILAQMEWMTEAPWVLGTYMLERELSNAFISVAVDGVDARRALDTAVKRINRETYRKLEEFGYWKDGVMLKEFPTPDATVVQKLIDEYNQKKEAEK